MNGKPLTGSMIAQLLTSFIEATNNRAAPDVTSAWEGVLTKER